MYKKNDIVKAIVTGLEPYGVFVQIDDNYSGMIHISEISNKYVKNISDYIKLNELIFVKIKSIDETSKKMNLTIKGIKYKMNNNIGRRKLVETKHGFSTLKAMLPAWIKTKNKKSEKN